MLNLNKSNFQAHPFHLVSPSPWPLYTFVSLLSLTASAVLSFHGFAYAEYNLFLSLTALILSMSFCFRDIIAEGVYIGHNTRLFLPFIFVKNHFISSIIELYKRHSKLLKLIVFIIGFVTITYLLGLNLFPFSILVIFIISIILSAYIITKEKHNNLHCTLNSLALSIVNIVSTFTYLAITPEFGVNFPHSSEITVILLALGTARILNLCFVKPLLIKKNQKKHIYSLD